MIKIPAICDNCGTIFPSGFSAENAFNITLSNNKSGLCPKCGGMGHLPDGTFNFVYDTIVLLQGPKRTKSELVRFQKLLQDVKQKSSDPDVVKKVLLKETGELKSIANFLPKNKADLYAFITILLMILELILNSPKKEACSQNINVNSVINKIYINTNK
ncbi:MAG: hypothetical protein WC894_06105 [Patescibacteria group bacterium]